MTYYRWGAQSSPVRAYDAPDVGMRGEVIAAVEPDLPREAAVEVLDVTGKYVFPGIVDVHVHPSDEEQAIFRTKFAPYRPPR